MGEDGDDIVSLPVPPPPNPAARRSGIDAALSKFDGIDPAPARRTQWAAMNRRPAGALVAAALVAIIAIPAIQVALREDDPAPLSEAGQSAPAPAQPDALAVSEPLDTALADAVAAEEAPAPMLPRAQPPAADRLGFAPAAREEKARTSVPQPVGIAPAAPAMASPPPPAPPPPPPARRAAEPQAQAEADRSNASEDENIIVTGSRMRKQQLGSAAPVAVIDPHADFLSRLQAAMRANDRQAIIRLTAIPLRVNYGSETRTYSTARDVERDFDRIFTAEVRASVLGRGGLDDRGDARLKSSGRILFGCRSRICSSADSVRIREVNP